MLGAGSMIDAGGVSTSDITKEVYKVCEKHKLKTGEPILDVLTECYNVAQPKTINKDINFEVLFDLLENCVEYQSPHYFDSASALLTDLKPALRELKDYNFFGIKRDYLRSINGIIHDYDERFEAKSGWMKSFFLSLIQRENCFLDVFNLNYDTWIERILGEYNDGFTELEGYNFKRFDSRIYLNEKMNMHTVSHLHGQICFDSPNFVNDDINMFAYEEQNYTLYKYPSFESAEEYRRGHTRSDGKSQSGHNIFLSNIITGRMKTDKITWRPMQIYLYGFIKRLMESNELIIIGYGFGDNYINSLLYDFLAAHRNKHVRIITKVDFSRFEEKTIVYGDPFDCDEESRFVKCAMKSEVWCSPYNIPQDGRFVSKDKVCELYLNGFEDYAKKYIRGAFD